MLRFFLPPRDLARLVTLLAALIAVIATLIITLGADRQGYFEFVDNLPAYLKLYTSTKPGVCSLSICSRF